MSASILSPPRGTSCSVDGKELRRFEFSMSQPIPSYLVALVVGNLVSAPIGPRSRVWTEPAMVEAAQHEFEGITERYLSKGEELFGPYLWEQYDVVVMPPGFPFGGMENPRLTFVTPCLVVGDRSLTDTIAHEIAHSWFGNLVCNATWSDFFLNEGFTMYAQRRITSLVDDKAYTQLEALAGWHLLKDEVEEQGKDSPLTRLRVPIDQGEDPEDTYNDVPYEKGFALVSYLRSAVGCDKAFDGWLKAYVADFKFQSIMAEAMFSHFLNHFPDLAAGGIEHRPGLEFSRWLHEPGMPPFVPDHSAAQPLIEPARDLLERIKKGDVGERNAVEGWRTYQIMHFLDSCLQEEQCFNSEEGRAVLARVGKQFGFASTRNAEISLRWCQLVIKSSLMSGLEQVERFLKSQGKQGYTVAIYRALRKGNDKHREFALRMFEETRPNLHANVRKYVSKVLNDPQQQT